MKWNKSLIDKFIRLLFGEVPFYYDRMLGRLYWGGIGGYVNTPRFAIYEAEPNVMELDFRGDTESAKRVINEILIQFPKVKVYQNDTFEDVYYIKL